MYKPHNYNHVALAKYPMPEFSILSLENPMTAEVWGVLVLQ